MAFVSSSESVKITIANDVFTFPDGSTNEERIAVSFAVAQSSMLGIFEAQIEDKVKEYKYIPETLAATGKVKLTQKQLGNMIGAVFVIRHDVNLHTELLDTPDWLWSHTCDLEDIYNNTCQYLEMAPRTEVLNKRLDMLKQLLTQMQRQQESTHNVKLEWIVIYLILISVVLELVSVAGKDLGLW